VQDTLVKNPGIDNHIITIKGDSEAIKAARCRAIKVFTIDIVVGTMTGTLEAIAVIAERYGAA
jgi:hypothetical protein